MWFFEYLTIVTVIKIKQFSRFDVLLQGEPGKCPIEQYHAVNMEDDIAGCSGFTSDTWKDIPLHASFNSNAINHLN